MMNGVLMQYFEWNLPNDGQLWTQLKEDAAHLSERGITAVWIPPAYKADEQEDEGYATYDLYDFGEFDQKGTVRTKYGARTQLEEAIGALHDAGVNVYLDAVLNHKAGGDYPEVFKAIASDEEDRTRTHGHIRKIKAYTGYDFKGRGDKYSDYKWHWYDFSGTDYDALRDAHGVFRIVGEGKGWSHGVDTEKGNYDYLLANDIDLDRPEVIAELNRWGKWAAEEFAFDGFRMDAIKHMDRNFTSQFVDEMRKERGEDFFVVGEYWNGDIESLKEFSEATGNKIALFDVPLHYNFFTASQQGKDFDLTTLLDNTVIQYDSRLAVTFVDNHDSQRGSSLESTIDDWFKPLAYGLILLMKEGYPTLFYGDYYSMGGVASPHRAIIDCLLDARQKYAYGEQTLHFDHPSTVGLVRHGDDEHPDSGLVFLMSNDEGGSKHMSLGELRAGEVWHEITGSIPEEITLDEEGSADFPVAGRNIAVWVKK